MDANKWEKAETLEEEIGKKYIGNITVWLIFTVIFIAWTVFLETQIPSVLIASIAVAFGFVDWMMKGREIDEFLRGSLTAYFFIFLLSAYHLLGGSQSIPADFGLFYIAVVALAQNFAYWAKIPDKIRRRFL